MKEIKNLVCQYKAMDEEQRKAHIDLMSMSDLKEHFNDLISYHIHKVQFIWDMVEELQEEKRIFIKLYNDKK